MKMWRRNATKVDPQPEVDWNDRIDLQFAKFGLDPNLPEVAELREAIVQYTDDDVRRGMIELLVEHLDPN